MIYFDNAATSWPKPDCVHEAMSAYMRDVGANPGRSGHRLANEAERLRLDAREALAGLLGISDPMRVVFTLNATEALNIVIRGLLPPGAHVVTTSMEHNSVMRPMRAAEQHGASVSIVPCHNDGTVSPSDIEGSISPDTRLIVVNHASNVCGTVLPIDQIGTIARRHGIPFLVDAAQTTGCWPANLASDRIDLLAFTGHKALLGPSGTGGLAICDAFDISLLPPLMSGGTGSQSERETHPDFLPDKYESGTPNVVGLAGLGAALRYVRERGVSLIRQHERSLTKRLITGLRSIPGARVSGTGDPDQQTATVSFTIDGTSCSELAHVLDERFGILCRPGLHCAPQAHRTLGTFPEGTVRFSLGLFNTEAEVDRALQAVTDLAGARCRA
jgi:cysteine desulfurase family protein